MIDSSSGTAFKTTTINSHQSGKEKKSKTFFALSSQENCAKYSPTFKPDPYDSWQRVCRRCCGSHVCFAPSSIYESSNFLLWYFLTLSATGEGSKKKKKKNFERSCPFNFLASVWLNCPFWLSQSFLYLDRRDDMPVLNNKYINETVAGKSMSSLLEAVFKTYDKRIRPFYDGRTIYLLS